MADFTMPILGADMEAGTLVAWRKQPGDRLERGDVIAEVETEKGLIEVEVFTPGILERFLVQPGTKVPVGTVLASIRTECEPGAAAPGVAPPPPAAPSVPSRAAPGAPRLRISPAARVRAATLGIDPASLTGTGPEGARSRTSISRRPSTSRPCSPGWRSRTPGDRSRSGSWPAWCCSRRWRSRCTTSPS